MITLRRLIWDDFNVDHIAKHDVLPAEVEAVCHGAFLLLEGKQGRLLVIGETNAGRMLTIVLAPGNPEQGVYYPVTARPASQKERRLFLEHVQKGDS